MATNVMKVVRIKEFTETPGPRAREEGPFSGDEFLETVLLPAYLKAREEGESLLVDLDGTEGYATSFLEATFGGLARRFEAKDILNTISFKSDDEPYLINEIKGYIFDARNAPQR
jgi:hypothetical protein